MPHPSAIQATLDQGMALRDAGLDSVELHNVEGRERCTQRLRRGENI